MKAPLLHVASQVFDQCLAIVPEKLDAILHFLGPRLDSPHQSAIDSLFTERLLLGRTKGLPDGVLAFDDDYDSPQQSQPKKPYQLTDAGVAIIPIKGTLLKKGDWMSALSGCTSYASISNAFSAAIDDTACRGILLDIDSPGGTTHGCFELADLVYSSRSIKPIYAAANDLAASAAYALGSSAEKLSVTRTGAVGSIGVFMLHCDQEGADKQNGLKYTYIFAGDKKVDGNPHESLSRSAKRDCQAETDRQYQLFIDCVSRNRSASPAKIQDTEAGVFSAATAIPLLADSVGTFDDALAALTKRVSRSVSKTTGRAASTHATIPNSSSAVSQGDNDMSVTLASLLASASPEELAQLAALASASKEDGKPEGKSEPKDKKMKSAPKDKEDEEDEDDEDEKKKDGEDDEDDEPEPKKKGKKSASADDMKSKPKKEAKKDDEEDCEPGASKAAAASFADMGATIESISDMCMVAKRPDLIAHYTKMATKGKSLAAIRAKFQDSRAAESGRDPIDNTAPDRSGIRSDVMGSATDALIQRSRTIAANSAGRLTPPAALSAVIHADPSIYDAYLNERADAMQSRISSRQFHEAQQARMKGLGLCADSTQLPSPRA